jgi:hypothetical protein
MDAVFALTDRLTVMVNGCVIANGTREIPHGRRCSKPPTRAKEHWYDARPTQDPHQRPCTPITGPAILRGVNFTLGHGIGLMGSATVRAKARCSKPRRAGAAACEFRHHHGSGDGRPPNV